MAKFFVPSDVPAAQLPIVKKPTLGGEMRVKLSTSNAVLLGTITVTAADTISWVPDAAGAVALSAVPMTVIVVADNVVNGGSADPAFTLTGTDAASAALVGTATFKVPTYSDISVRKFVAGWAVDAEHAADKKFKTITTVTADIDADAVNGRFRVFGVPALSTFAVVGCTTDKDFTFKSREPIAIGCGLNRSAFVKPGETPVGQLNIKSKWVSLTEGLARFAGSTVTAMVEVVKEDLVISDRLLFIGYVPTVKGNGPESAGEAMFDGTGLYEDIAILVPQSA